MTSYFNVQSKMAISQFYEQITTTFDQQTKKYSIHSKYLRSIKFERIKEKKGVASSHAT